MQTITNILNEQWNTAVVDASCVNTITFLESALSLAKMVEKSESWDDESASLELSQHVV